MNSSDAPLGPRVRNSLINNCPAPGSTASTAGELVTVAVPLFAEARISVEPFARPVTIAVAEPVPEVALTESMATAALLEAKLTVTPPMFWPNWSFACPVNCCVSPTPIVTVSGEIVALASTGAACRTVRLANGD